MVDPISSFLLGRLFDECIDALKVIIKKDERLKKIQHRLGRMKQPVQAISDAACRPGHPAQEWLGQLQGVLQKACDLQCNDNFWRIYQTSKDAVRIYGRLEELLDEAIIIKWGSELFEKRDMVKTTTNSAVTTNGNLQSTVGTQDPNLNRTQSAISSTTNSAARSQARDGQTRNGAGGQTSSGARNGTNGQRRNGAGGQTRNGTGGQRRNGAGAQTRNGAGGQTRNGADGQTRNGVGRQTRNGAGGQTSRGNWQGSQWGWGGYTDDGWVKPIG